MERSAIITEKTFNAVKIMLKGGATGAEVSEYLKLGTTTVSRIRNCDTWEDFLLRKREAAIFAQKSKEKKAEQTKQESPKQPEQPKEQIVKHEQTVTIQATHYMMQELQKTNELLKLISNKLAMIVEDLYGKGEEK